MIPPSAGAVRRAALAALLAVSLGLAGCAQTSEPAPSPEATPAQAEGWPRTVTVPAGEHTAETTITIADKPARIAALDYESTEVLAHLGVAEQLVLIPEAMLHPALGGHAEAMPEHIATFPVAMEVDAETVIGLTPDLVIMSPRHGNEAPIAAVLQQAGITTLQLPESWTSSASLLTNLDLIAQTIGEEQTAAQLAVELTEGIADSAAGEKATADGGSAEAPRVIMLTNQAGRPFITAGDAYPIELLGLAGASSVAAELGIHRTGPITAEQLVQSNPDGIVLIDMNGTGDRMFTELLENPAVAAIPALADERVLRVTGRQVQALGVTETIAGLGALTTWVSTLD